MKNRMRRIKRMLLIAAVLVVSTVPIGCAGAYVGVSVPVGYPHGGYGPYGGWGPRVGVGVTVPLGRPAQY